MATENASTPTTAGTANVPGTAAGSQATAGAGATPVEGQAAVVGAAAEAGAGGSDTASTAAAGEGQGTEGAAEGSAAENTEGQGDAGQAGAEGEGTGDQPETLTVPEGIVITPEWSEKIDAFAGARNLDHAGKQAIVDMGVELHQQLLSEITNAHKERVEAWASDARKEHGQKFDAVVSAAQDAFARFGDAELKQLMVDYGIGNHPAMLRAFSRVAAQVSEPRGVVGATGGAAAPAGDPNSEQARADRMAAAAVKRGGRAPDGSR